MPYKLERVSDPEAGEVLADDRFVAIATCPHCGARWQSSGSLRPGDPDAREKAGARRVEMLAQLRNGCPECAQRGAGVRSRQHGRLRSAWPGSRR